MTCEAASRMTTTRLLVMLGLIQIIANAAFAQRRGQPPPAAPSTPEEKQRAQTAAEWADMIEHARANLPQHPPDQVIRFPSKNAVFLAGLRVAENPRADLSRHLEKLWTTAKDLEERRTAALALWTEAEKPPWVRVAIDDFFRQRSPAAPLHGPKPSPAPQTATVAPEKLPEKVAEKK
jgi:hypothetical protein